MKMYRTGSSNSVIEEKEVVRTTGKKVFYMAKPFTFSDREIPEVEHGEFKVSSYHKWFDSREEAKAFLLARIDRYLANAEDTIKRLQEEKEILLSKNT
jgi:hypothetical protein